MDTRSFEACHTLTHINTHNTHNTTKHNTSHTQHHTERDRQRQQREKRGRKRRRQDKRQEQRVTTYWLVFQREPVLVSVDRRFGISRTHQHEQIFQRPCQDSTWPAPPDACKVQKVFSTIGFGGFAGTGEKGRSSQHGLRSSLLTCLRSCMLLPEKSQLIGLCFNASPCWSLLIAGSESHELTNTSLSDPARIVYTEPPHRTCTHASSAHFQCGHTTLAQGETESASFRVFHIHPSPQCLC